MSISDAFEFIRQAVGAGSDGRTAKTASDTVSGAPPVPANSFKGQYGPAAAAKRAAGAFVGPKPEAAAGGEPSNRNSAPVQDTRGSQPRGYTAAAIDARSMAYGLRPEPPRGTVNPPANDWPVASNDADGTKVAK